MATLSPPEGIDTYSALTGSYVTPASERDALPALGTSPWLFGAGVEDGRMRQGVKELPVWLGTVVMDVRLVTWIQCRVAECSRVLLQA